MKTSFLFIIYTLTFIDLFNEFFFKEIKYIIRARPKQILGKLHIFLTENLRKIERSLRNQGDFHYSTTHNANDIIQRFNLIKI